MLYLINTREEPENLEELALLKTQEEFRLQDKVGKQNCHYEARNLQEPHIDTIDDTSEFTRNYKRNLQY